MILSEMYWASIQTPNGAAAEIRRLSTSGAFALPARCKIRAEDTELPAARVEGGRRRSAQRTLSPRGRSEQGSGLFLVYIDDACARI
jgi:hypothetical protein